MPILYQWLQGSSPAAANALIGAQGPLTSAKETFEAHRGVWEGIRAQPSPDLERSEVEHLLQDLSDQAAPEIQGRDILTAKERIKMGTQRTLSY